MLKPDQVPSRLTDDGVDYVIQDAGNAKTIKCTKQGGMVELVIGAGSESRTLINPRKSGLRLTISVKTIGAGSSTVVAETTGAFLDGTTTRSTITFDSNLKYAVLTSMYVGGGLKWVKVVASATFS